MTLTVEGLTLTVGDTDGAPNLVVENATPGTVVSGLALQAKAQIPSFNFSIPLPAALYTLTNDAGGRFALAYNTSDDETVYLKVAPTAVIDYEAGTAYPVTVQIKYVDPVDGTVLKSTTQDFVINLADVDEFAPVVTTSAGTTTAPEQVPTVVDGGLTVQDPDGSGAQVSATVRISSGLASGEDALVFTPSASTGNISGVYDAGTGVLTLASAAPNATRAQWQAALRSVSYLNSSDTPTGTSRVVSFQISGAAFVSNMATKTLLVQDVSDAPTITSFTPNPGQPGNSITIIGTKFTGTTGVSFGGTAAAGFTLVSDTELTAVVPPCASSGLIQVTTALGQGSSSQPLTVVLPKPVLTSVPTDQVVVADPGQCMASVSLQAQASGVPAPALTYTIGGVPISSPYAFPLGQSIVTVTATNCGGSVTGTYMVTVLDKQAPVAAARNVTVTLVNGTATITPAQLNNGSSDNCTSAAALGLRLDKTTFTCDNIGTNQVKLTVTDASNNQSTAQTTVTVLGTKPMPSIVVSPSTTLYLGYGPQTATLTASGGGPGATYSWNPGTYLNATKSAATTFTATKAGSFTYTVTVTSASGCTATASTTLTVIDARCGNKNDKVIVCHNGMALCINSADVADHLAHGDQLGACPSKSAATSARAVASLTGSEPADATPLLEAYPNPFTASTTVRFRAAQEAAMRVVVYNVLGQPVATLYDGPAQAGQLTGRTLGGSSLAAGLYTIRLTGGGQSLVQKVVLTK